MAKLAVPITLLLALLGSVASQNTYAPGPSPQIPKAMAYPPIQSPLSSTVPPPTYPPNPSSPIYPPSPSPLSSTPPTNPPPSAPSPTAYPPSPSLLSPTPTTSPPNASPSPTTYPSSISLAPLAQPPNANQPTTFPSPSYAPTTNPSPVPSSHPPSANPPAYTSPSPIPPPPTTNPYVYTSLSPSPSLASYAPSISPIPIPPSHPPSASPLMYPSPSLSPSIPSPSYAPNLSPSPSSSISSPPTYHPSPNPSPSSSISSPPTYPPNPSPLMYPSSGPSIMIPSPSYTPSPNPSSSMSSPPTYPPSPSPSSSISSPLNYPPSPSPAPSGLTVGYYRYSCLNAENIVREAVKNATDSNRGTGAGLIRLFFHDCFVEGCDASVLLNTTGTTQPTERASAPNLSLRGFEVIDAAKAVIEAACPGVVSCADIVAFAGRDATFFLSGNAVDFDMPAGRYDGRVSLDSAAIANLPPPFASLQELKDKFAAKGLDTEDMVTLSGAHTIGRSHCSSFFDRLPPNASDMNATLVASLTSQCNGIGNRTVPQDLVTPSGLDKQYYRNVLNHEVLFGSDAALLASNQTAGMVRDNAFTPGLWEDKFKAAMVKMGSAGIKNSTDGEIRKKCWMVNQVSS